MVIFVLPVVGQGSLRAPGGVVGGYPVSDSTYRSQSTLKMALGSQAVDPATGNIYTLVKAGAAIAVNKAVAFNAGLADVRASSATQQLVVGVADTAFASGDTGWLLTHGIVVCILHAATAAGALLVTEAVSGSLNTAAAGDFATRGAVCTIAESGGTGTIYLA